MKIIVISPHCGDAAFSLALAVEAWVGAGHKVTVLNCFSRSEEAPFSDAASVHANDRMSFVTALRGREDEAWRRQYGSALTLTDITMKDAPKRLHRSPDEVYGLSVNPAEKSVLKIQKAIEQMNGDALVVPLALAGHVDHVIARHALATTASSGSVCAFYEDLPYAGASETIREQVRELARDLGVSLVPSFVVGPADMAVSIARKRRAMLCYDSQIDDAEIERIAMFCMLYEGRERLWANPGWAESDLDVSA